MKDYDHRMHTAEHILNQTMMRMFGCNRAFSSHIERRKSKCDYRFNRPLTMEEEKELEVRVNEVIEWDLAVGFEMVTYDEAAERYNLDRLPEEAIDEEHLRIVHVGEYDACPCIGEHVSQTKEIGKFSLISTSFGDGVLRVRFKLS
jgi:alanyl-tRNA synthetase